MLEAANKPKNVKFQESVLQVQHLLKKKSNLKKVSS